MTRLVVGGMRNLGLIPGRSKETYSEAPGMALRLN